LPLTKEVIVWKQLCLMAIHWLFKISGTKLSMALAEATEKITKRGWGSLDFIRFFEG
jgi:hypothetical protein